MKLAENCLFIWRKRFNYSISFSGTLNNIPQAFTSTLLKKMRNFEQNNF